MRVFLAIIIIALLALLTDFYIYRRVFRGVRSSRWGRIYIWYSVFIDAAVVTALLVFRKSLDMQSTLLMRAAMWVIGIFFLHAVPKFIYAAVSLGDYLSPKPVRGARGIFSLIGAIAGTIMAGVIICGLTFGRSQVRVTTVELEFEKLPRTMDGLRIVQFSDTHIGTMVHRDRFLRRLVDVINGLDGDIVVNTGDIVNTHAWELDDAAMDIFGSIRGRYGVYSVYGNHDLGMYIRDTVRYTPRANVDELARKYGQLGWNLLVNETVFFSNGRDSITISGLNYPSGFYHNGHSSSMTGVDFSSTYGDIPDSLFNITLSHAPQLWNELIAEGRADLTLAGHVHAMQSKVRIGKWQWSPARLMYERWSGLYHQGGQYLYINDGAGYVMFPMRIGTRPEITLFILRSKPNR